VPGATLPSRITWRSWVRTESEIAGSRRIGLRVVKTYPVYQNCLDDSRQRPLIDVQDLRIGVDGPEVDAQPPQSSGLKDLSSCSSLRGFIRTSTPPRDPGDVEEILSAVEDICCKSRAGVMQVARAAAERDNGFPLPMRVAYHDACHLAHAQGIRRQPRELLAAIPNLTLVPLAENEVCCGGAGIFNLGWHVKEWHQS
jgi:cysteine-rich protein